MKSLEIVNEKIEDTKYPTGSLERPVWDDESIINTSELETIKQDLEVLEIIRKKRVDILALECRINTFKDDNERILHSYNAMFYNKKIYKLTMEELLKLKQWLEDNE